MTQHDPKRPGHSPSSDPESADERDPASYRHAPSMLPFSCSASATPGDEFDEDPTELGLDAAHRHAISVPPWMDAAKSDEPAWAQTTPGGDPTFAFGDSRKPQLSKHVAEPLGNAARRSSGIQPRARASRTETPALQDDQAQAPAPPTLPAIATGPARGASKMMPTSRPSQIRPAAIQSVSATTATTATARRSSIIEQVTARSAMRDLDGQLLGIAGLIATAISLALPATPDGAPLWRALVESPACTWPVGMTLAAGATALSGLLGLVALAGGSLRSPEHPSATPDAGGVFASLLGVIALLLREGASPGLLSPPTWPMRGDLIGLPVAIWCGLGAAALWGVSRRQNQRPARWLGAVAAVALLVTYWQPLVWLGKTTLPLFAAIGARASTELHGSVIQDALMASPLGTVLLALLGPAILAILMLPRAPSSGALDGLGVAAIAAPSLAVVLGVGGFGLASLGAAASTLGVAAFVAAATAASLSRWDDRIDEDTASMLENLAMLGILVVFALLKIQGGRYSATDEGIYFYAAKAWASGVWPYHDFFFSHPPLHVAIPAALFGIFGWSWPLAKAISAVAAGLTGIVIWRTGRRWFSPLGGVLAAMFFLFATETLKASTNLTGVNLTTFWLMLALWSALRERTFLAGLFAGAATATGIYAVGGAIALLGLLAFAPPSVGDDRTRSLLGRVFGSPAVQLLIGFALVFGTVHILGQLIGGEHYLDGVYRYHTEKKIKTAGYVPLDQGPLALTANLMAMLQSKDFLISFYYHAAHLWLAALAPVAIGIEILLRRANKVPPTEAGAAAARRAPVPANQSMVDPDHWAMMFNPRRWWLHLRAGGALWIIFIVGFALLGELAQLHERYDFYYALLLPMASLAAAGTLRVMLVLVRAAVGAGVADADITDSRTLEGGPIRAPAWARWAAPAAAITCALWVPLDSAANRSAFASEFVAGASGKGAGELLTFEWLDSPGPQGMSDFGKAMFWQSWRVRGNLETGIHHYLWSKKRWFSTAEEIAAVITSRGKGNETITGASTYAPLVALLASRRMASDHVDTNSKTFKTGFVDEAEFWQRACKDNLRFVIAAPQSWFTPATVQRKPTIQRHFRLLQEFRDPHLKHWREELIQLWERRSDEPCRYESGTRSEAPSAAMPSGPATALPGTNGEPGDTKAPAGDAEASAEPRKKRERK